MIMLDPPRLITVFIGASNAMGNAVVLIASANVVVAVNGGGNFTGHHPF